MAFCKIPIFVVLLIFVGSCLSEPDAKPDPAPKPKAFPEALAEAVAKAFPAPQLGLGLGPLLNSVGNLLMGVLLALMGKGLKAGCSDGGPPGISCDCSVRGRDGF